MVVKMMVAIMLAVYGINDGGSGHVSVDSGFGGGEDGEEEGGGGGGDCDADALRSKRGREREERGGGVKKQAFASCSADSTQRAVREVACLSAIFSVVPVTVVIVVVVMACGGEGVRW